jgi:hypothetical protein
MLEKYKHKRINLNEHYSLMIFEEQHIPEVTVFVAKVYYKQEHFEFEESLEELAHKMCQADNLRSSYTTIFCLMNDDKLCCTSRLIKREGMLPFEEEFDVDLNFFMDKNKRIYEFARFASDGNISFRELLFLFDYMLRSVNNRSDLVVASLDKEVFRKFVRLRYPVYKLGLPLNYLGSLSVPVAIKLSELPLDTAHYKRRHS